MRDRLDSIVVFVGILDNSGSDLHNLIGHLKVSKCSTNLERGL